MIEFAGAKIDPQAQLDLLDKADCEEKIGRAHV